MARVPERRPRCTTTGKIKFATEAQALGFLDRVVHMPGHAYRCKHCKKFHMAIKKTKTGFRIKRG